MIHSQGIGTGYRLVIRVMIDTIEKHEKKGVSLSLMLRGVFEPMVKVME